VFFVSEHHRFAHLCWVSQERGGIFLYSCYLPRAHKGSNYTEGHSIKGGRAPTWLVTKKKESWLIKWFNPGLEATAPRHSRTQSGGGGVKAKLQVNTERHNTQITAINWLFFLIFDLLEKQQCKFDVKPVWGYIFKQPANRIRVMIGLCHCHQNDPTTFTKTTAEGFSALSLTVVKVWSSLGNLNYSVEPHFLSTTMTYYDLLSWYRGQTVAHLHVQ